MINIVKIQIAFILCAFSITANAQKNDMNIPDVPNALTPYQASYTLFRKGAELGKGQQKLEKTEDGYHISHSSNMKWMFLSDIRKENSKFTVENNIVTAQHYHYERTGTGRDREETIVFSKDNIKAVYKNNEDNFKVIQPTFDPILYQVIMRDDLIKESTTLSYPMIRRCKETEYTFKRISTETVKTPMGRFEAIKLQRIRKKSNRNTLIWVAPSLNYSIVKMTHFEDGQEQADLQINWLHFED